MTKKTLFIYRVNENLQPTEVMSIQAKNEAGKLMVFGCAPTDQPSAVKNSIKMKCDGCPQEVWMSPETKKIFDKTDKKIILCINCMLKQIEIKP